MKESLQSSDVERFRVAIARRTGLAFDDSKLGFLAEVLESRLEATHETVARYSTHLENPSGPPGELAELARELTVPETYFFRHFDQFRAFSDVALPQRMAASPNGRLCLLSAGCASGEEAFSLAILARERMLETDGRLTVRAVDLNPAMLERARRGRYSGWALREAPDELRGRWFTAEGREFVLDSSIRAGVTFEHCNLVDDDPERWKPSAYDVIFCRNVLMYLTADAARSVVGRLTRALVPDGYLFLGHAETLRGLSQDYHLLHTHDTFYYRRKTELGVGVTPAEPRETLRQVLIEAAPRVDLSTSWIETIQSASDRIKRLTEPLPERLESALVPPVDTRGDLDAALDLLRNERFGEALHRLERLPLASARDHDVLLLRASLLAHNGELVRAEMVCLELISVDELSAGAHYLFALCREGRGDTPGAIDHDQIAAYLDEEFAMPRLHLGLMARRAGQREIARRELEQAIKLLAREDASRLLLFGGGFGRDGLITLCRAELARLGGGA